jgi:hypothetical protein
LDIAPLHGGLADPVAVEQRDRPLVEHAGLALLVTDLAVDRPPPTAPLPCRPDESGATGRSQARHTPGRARSPVSETAGRARSPVSETAGPTVA